MPKPCVFKDEDELARALAKAEKGLFEWLEDLKPRDFVIHHSVGPNTFRTFRGVKEPSKIFRGWAERSLTRWLKRDDLRRIKDQQQYDRWTRSQSRKLRDHWNKTSTLRIKYSQRSKLLDLLMKEVLRWNDLDPSVRKKLQKWAHVPLDSYLLRAIRECVDNPTIPHNASMGFVKDRRRYVKLQKAASGIAKRAGVDRICLDFLAWNVRHQ